jgi:hypothetical protein
MMMMMTSLPEATNSRHDLRERPEQQPRKYGLRVAFTKEESAETAAETLLPDRPISPHPNGERPRSDFRLISCRISFGAEPGLLSHKTKGGWRW